MQALHDAYSRKKTKVYAVRRHDWSLCTQKQPEMHTLYSVCIYVIGG